MTRPAPFGAQAPFFAPIARWFAETDPRPRGELDLEALNDLSRQRSLRTGSGYPLRFVDARDATSSGYERSVDESGRVPTRTRRDGMLHDWLNALAWLAFPRSKARLNAIHATALGERTADEAAASCGQTPTVSSQGRGRVRDAATLFDENGAVFACRDRGLRDALVARNWKTLFVHERVAFVRHVQVVVFGHALFEKLLDPYKAICAHAIVLSPADTDVDAAAVGAGVDGADAFEAIDAALATHLRAETLAAGVLHPLPLLGVPGWWGANEDPAFYDDERVFRGERSRTHVALDGSR